MSTVPKNCNECGFSSTCRAAYYGSSTCKHEKEINERRLAEFWQRFDKKK